MKACAYALLSPLMLMSLPPFFLCRCKCVSGVALNFFQPFFCLLTSNFDPSGPVSDEVLECSGWLVPSKLIKQLAWNSWYLFTGDGAHRSILGKKHTFPNRKERQGRNTIISEFSAQNLLNVGPRSKHHVHSTLSLEKCYSFRVMLCSSVVQCRFPVLDNKNNKYSIFE